uniref:Ovule protein n=1 Tax=Panagrolaimus sp. PS1159 TaxID=55785 RepID=A0AC35F810_9BILA
MFFLIILCIHPFRIKFLFIIALFDFPLNYCKTYIFLLLLTFAFLFLFKSQRSFFSVTAVAPPKLTMVSSF